MSTLRPFHPRKKLWKGYELVGLPIGRATTEYSENPGVLASVAGAYGECEKAKLKPLSDIPSH